MKQHTITLFLFSGVFFPLCGTAQQIQQASIEEVAVHANRLQIPFGRDSRNVEVLTAADIRKLPATSLNEVLAFLNGVDIRQRGPFGTQADLAIDGGTFEQTLLLVNGAKVADPQTAHHNLNLPVPLEAIERIEVLRGPAARIYGTNALTGAVNIITKEAEKTAVVAHLHAGSGFKKRTEEAKPGMYYHSGALVGASLARKNHRHQLYYGREKSNGQRYNTASANDRAFYQGSWDADARNKVEWMGAYLHNAFGANGFYAAPGDREAEEIVRTFFGSIASRHQLSERLYLSPRLSHRDNRDDYRYFRHDLARARSEHSNNALAAEMNGRYQTAFGDFGLGWESRFERIRSSNIGRRERDNHGAYAEFRTESIHRLRLNAGAYLNYNSQYGWQVYPGMDMGYDLSDGWTAVLNAGSSQRIPSFTDLYLDQRPGNVGNPDLLAENAQQIETALKFRTDRITAHAGYFRREIRDFIGWVRADASEPYRPVNVHKNTVNGFNGNVHYRFRTGPTALGLNLGYNYLRPSVRTDGTEQSKYAMETLKHQAKLLLAARRDGWALSLANRFNRRISSDRSYFLADVRLSRALGIFTLYADAQNLLDVTYIESAAVPMPGRWFSVGVSVGGI